MSMTAIGTIAGRYSARRWQATLLDADQYPENVAAFREAMSLRIQRPDCPYCGWPSARGSVQWCQRVGNQPAGSWAPGCVDPWHQVAEGVLLGLLGKDGSGADFSLSRRYRYELRRRWTRDGLTVGWVMCNPSVAGEDVDDQTIRKVCGFSKAWGFGGAHVWNLSALVSTDPDRLELHPDPTGPDNERYMTRAAAAPLLVCAWGDIADRTWSNEVRRRLVWAGATLAHLGLTAKASPRHPVRLGYDTELIPW